MTSMLPYEARMKRLTEVQDDTILKIKEAWEIKGSAVAIRPTGFGKTFTVGKLLRERKEDGSLVYNNIVFVCPSDSIKEQIKSELYYESADRKPIDCNIYDNGKLKYICGQKGKNIKRANVYLATYALIARRFGDKADLTEDDVKSVFGDGNVDLIIMDEFHHAGAAKTMIGLLGVLSKFKNAKKLGLTATYNRSDKADPGFELFGPECLIEEYNYVDAAMDGILPTIHYFYNNYASWVEQKHKLEQIENGNDAKLNPILAAEIIEAKKQISAQKLLDMGSIIRDNTEKTIGIDNMSFSQKWIVFFPLREKLKNEYQSVVDWFQSAYPDFEMRPVIVIGEDGYKDNLEKVVIKQKGFYNPDKEEKVIVLIFAVDMLLEGVHLDNVTGCILFSTTKSGIKFNQILGRAIDSQRDTDPVIMDMMCDYDILYENLVRNKELADMAAANGFKILPQLGGNSGGTGEKRNKEANDVTDPEELGMIHMMHVQSNEISQAQLYKLVSDLDVLARCTRLAIQIMNNKTGFLAVAKSENIGISGIMTSIRDIQRRKQLVLLKTMDKNSAEKMLANGKGIRIEETGMVNPMHGNEPIVNLIIEEGTALSDEEFKKIEDEYRFAEEVKRVETEVRIDKKKRNMEE